MITGDNALFLLLQMFSSGVAGYITNKYAVNMIFKEYTPLKIGGAVKKNKEKFIEEVSDLVERDIINSETIRNKVLGEDFQNAIKNTSKDFFQESLYEVFKNEKIEDIPGYFETLSKGEEFLKNNLKEVLPKLIDNLCEHTKVEDLLSDKQISFIVDYVYNEIINNLNSSEEIKFLVSDLFEEEGNIYLNQLIDKESGEKVTRIISCEIMNSIDEVLDNKKEIKSIIDKSLSLIDIKSLLKNLQNKMGSKTLDEILNEEQFDKLSLLIYEKLDELIKSDSGKEHVESLVKEAFVSVKDIELTLFEVLPIHFGRTSGEYLTELIKKIIPYLSSWIKENKEKIEEIIDGSIIESIDNIEDDLRKSMILKVKDSMLTDFSSKNQIVDKIVDFLENYDLNEENSYGLYSKIIKLLVETKIKDLFDLLEKNNLINEEKIVNLILEKWNEDGKELSKIIIKRESSKTLQKLIDQDLNKLFNKKIKPQLYNIAYNNKSKIISYLDKTIFNLVHDKIETMLNGKVKDLFSENQVKIFSNRLPSKVSGFLNKNNSLYKKNISKTIKNSIDNINLKEMIKNNEDKIVDSISESTVEFTKNSLEKYKSYEVEKVIDNINKKEEIYEEVSEKLYDGIKNNLPALVDGRVKKLIYDNLIKLDEEEICNIAQSFMGKQLKPLSMFGAFLGTIVGLIFGLTMKNVNGAYGFYNNTTNTLIACGLMGLVGILTNVIALWMIFCPYEQNKFIARIPLFRIFSIGYIPSHKNSFASGMAHFIDEELLSGNRVVNSFKLQKVNLKNHILANIKNSNYMMFLDFIKTKQSDISKKTYSIIVKSLKKHNNKICNKLSDKCLQLENEKLISLDFINNKVQTYLNNVNKFEDKMINYFESKLKNNLSLEEVLPKEVVAIVNNKIESDINDFINKNMENNHVEEIIKNLIIKNEKAYNLFMEKPLKEIISEKSILNIQKGLKTDKFMNILLLGIKEELNNHVQTYLSKEFSDEKRFDELFEGKIKEKLNKDIYIITEKLIDKLVEYMKNNNDNISAMVIKIVRGNLNFFVKMAYDFADGDSLVKDVINIVINNKIENLIKEDKDKLDQILYSYLEKDVYPSQIKDLGIKASEINTNLILDRFVFALKQNNDFKENINNTCDLLINNISEVKAKDIGEIVEINSINNLYSKYENTINSVANEVIENLKRNKSEVNEFVATLIENNIIKHFYSISLVEISWELNQEDVSHLVKNALQIIKNSEVIKHHILEFNKNVYKNSVENKTLELIFDKNIIVEDLDKILSSLLENKDFNDKNKIIVEFVLDKFLENKFEFISEESKSYVLEKLINCMLDTTEKNIIPILRSLDLKDITLEEVDEMHPKEIHELFKSFAGDFFIKLYIYGGFGLIFGVNVYLSIILFIIDIIYTKQIDLKVEQSQGKLFRD